jgi:RNA polymerase sigma-70 factor, ECF subfamily
MDDRDIRWQAVERAYREHADDVYKVALAILRDPDAAVDVTHDTFARAFDRWHQYDANRPLRAWLHGIASHAALDALRRRRVRAVAAPTIGRIHEARGSASLEGDPAPRVAERDLVADAMAGLKPDARAALVLRHAYGYDYAEIARFLRTSPGNVGSILSRAHTVLRDRLATTATEPTASERTTELPAASDAVRRPR